MSVRACSFLAVLLVGHAAAASTAVAMDVPQLTRRADVILRGTVSGQSSSWAPGGRRIVTETRVRVASVLKGAPAREVRVLQPGGAVGGVGQRVSGAARFADGEEVLLFLEHQRGDHYQVVGMAMGKFQVRKTAEGRGWRRCRTGWTASCCWIPPRAHPSRPRRRAAGDAGGRHPLGAPAPPPRRRSRPLRRRRRRECPVRNPPHRRARAGGQRSLRAHADRSRRMPGPPGTRRLPLLGSGGAELPAGPGRRRHGGHARGGEPVHRELERRVRRLRKHGAHRAVPRSAARRTEYLASPAQHEHHPLPQPGLPGRGSRGHAAWASRTAPTSTTAGSSARASSR